MFTVVASRVANSALQVQDTPTYFWGDSQIMFHWLSGTKPLPQFLQHRVVEIRTTLLLLLGTATRPQAIHLHAATAIAEEFIPQSRYWALQHHPVS